MGRELLEAFLLESHSVRVCVHECVCVHVSTCMGITQKTLLKYSTDPTFGPKILALKLGL